MYCNQNFTRCRLHFRYVYLYRRLSDNKNVVIKQIPMESISKDECEVSEVQHRNKNELIDMLIARAILVLMVYLFVNILFI